MGSRRGRPKPIKRGNRTAFWCNQCSKPVPGWRIVWSGLNMYCSEECRDIMEKRKEPVNESTG